jgi:23S rRNA pseudouridine1911/1915/1917 synthase
MAKDSPLIIFEDESIILATKPPGLLSIPDRFSAQKPNLVAMLNLQFGKVWVVHRLDRETSGLIVFARNEDAHRSLSLQFEQRQSKKTYLALLDGQLPHPEGTIENRLAENPAHPGKMMVAKKGKTAITHYRLVENFRQFCLVEARIETGRMHQIRVHFESIGHPLAIDSLYGRREALLLSTIKQKGFRLGNEQEERPLMSRLTLHAWKLEFEHPASGQLVSFEAPLPRDFDAVLKQLRKWGR